METTIPPCADERGHAWVSGRARKTEDGLEMLSRQCRQCGYEDVFEERSPR